MEKISINKRIMGGFGSIIGMLVLVSRALTGVRSVMVQGRVHTSPWMACPPSKFDVSSYSRASKEKRAWAIRFDHGARR